MTHRILLIGTYDTKADELLFLTDCITRQGAQVLTMDVSVLGDAPITPDISKQDIAAAADQTIDALIALQDEAAAFAAMSKGAARITADLCAKGAIDGLIALGGTMGTDLALDCANAVPIGVPKYIISTVAGSALIGADRLAPDVQFILWAGGLYGLNPLCKSTLSQAAGALVGSVKSAQPPALDKPLIGMTSLGSSCLSYMKRLHPELTARGFDVAVFHTTGMGGMAFERLAAHGRFACVMDFCLQELVNHMHGSLVSAGADRMTQAGRNGTPQIIAPGATDILDFAGWQTIPDRFAHRPAHPHNRLIKSVALSAEERARVAAELARRAASASGPTHVMLPLQGVEEWDRPGAPAHDPAGLRAFMDRAQAALTEHSVPLSVLDCHINDSAFCDAVLAHLDRWIEAGIVADPTRSG